MRELSDRGSRDLWRGLLVAREAPEEWIPILRNTSHMSLKHNPSPVVKESILVGLLSWREGKISLPCDFLKRSLDQKDHLVESIEEVEVEVKVMITLLGAELHWERSESERLGRRKEMESSAEQGQKSTGDE